MDYNTKEQIITGILRVECTETGASDFLMVKKLTVVVNSDGH